MDATKWTQGGHQEIITVKPMEQMVSCPTTSTCTTATRPNSSGTTLERKARPQERLNCPRCNSTNTKFCYYNNYSLTQPRYFCKGCRRYWTEGGSLRNVPVGGSSRKNKKSTMPSSTPSLSLSSSTSSAIATKLPDLNPPILFPNQTPKTPKSQDLDLSFPFTQEGHYSMSQYLHQIPKTEQSQPGLNFSSSSSSSTATYASPPLSAMELLRSGVASARGLNPMMPAAQLQESSQGVLYPSGFQLVMPDYRQSTEVCFSADGSGGIVRCGTTEVQENIANGRFLFPFGDMKQLQSTIQQVDHDRAHKNQGNSSTPAYCSGMFGGSGPSL